MGTFGFVAVALADVLVCLHVAACDGDGCRPGSGNARFRFPNSERSAASPENVGDAYYYDPGDYIQAAILRGSLAMHAA